ncbi:oxygen-independent coproporphyrinogen III oxidase [Thorsellia kenyensis]|uniref:Coproporphyrinogen-III oxidase n=1 Tax=Thorsellia kenyensis TaxID=1549888 RepID=A0ABV6CAG3_9GAMM
MPELILPKELIAKMDKAGPRYTSYPTADKFNSSYNEQTHKNTLSLLEKDATNEINSLYFHIPFCKSVCFYCACNKVITMHQYRADSYVDILLKEIALVSSHFDKKIKVGQIHFGGGTPTYISDEQIAKILLEVKKYFDVTEDLECGIEIDPRTVDHKRLIYLQTLGFNRISIGVQDFDGDVQKAVHRIQPFRQVAELYLTAKKLGIPSINMDMIYGLPKQTEETFSHSLETLLDLRPDRVALYAYAHIPERFKPQRRINEEDLPSADERLKLLSMAIYELTKAGYIYIGMDHFALPDDPLAIAKKRGELQRNFQGYSTHAKSNLIAFGVSAISHINGHYAQNHKELDDYVEAVEQNKLPTLRGYSLSKDDLLRNEVIMQLMCKGKISFTEIEDKYSINFQTYFSRELLKINSLVEEELCVLNSDSLEVTTKGWFLIRAIAMQFDKYLQQKQVRLIKFSKIV